MGDFNADRSSIEIKNLLRKLHPNEGNHRDRVRGLTKFRNYVMGDGKGNTPEFYDDDIPVLFLGPAAPAAYLDPDDDTLQDLHGLLQACGMPSGEHGNDGNRTLKRSARHAMNLLKWLLLDWKESNAPAAKKGEKQHNLFTTSFLCLEAQYYHVMNLDLHCAGDDRGGARDDACRVVVLILTEHLAEDGESQQPVILEELMSNPKAQQEFEIWISRHCSASTQETIKKNATARQSELAQQQREQQQHIHKAASGMLVGDDFDHEDSDHDADHHHHQQQGQGQGGQQDNDGPGGTGTGGLLNAVNFLDDEDEDDDDDDVDDYYGDDDGDVMAAFRKRQKDLRKTLRKTEGGRGEITAGVATRWEDSQLAREQRARAAQAARAGLHETVRESQDAAAEAAEREEEKAKVLGKDPLGILAMRDFDLRSVEEKQAEHMERALHEFQEALQKAESSGAGTATEDVRKVAARKDSLESLVDRLGGIEVMENAAKRAFSILPTDPRFDPILFLTLMHRNATYQQLLGSMGRLSSKTENQVEQLQNLVRDNFPLFVRCAEGFEEFRQQSHSDGVGSSVNERIDTLEGIAESCSHQAKKSFKPLLDNTSEVRKVQSSLRVLQRVAPILQVPALMKQHVENKRYSAALKTYRRVLVVDDTCQIVLLRNVKRQAEECVREARHELEHRISQGPAAVSVDGLLDAIRDLGELLELDVPNTTTTTTTRQKDNADGDDDDEEKELDVHDLTKEEDFGTFTIGGVSIHVRDHPPPLACLLLQAAHFAQAAKELIAQAESSTQRIFAGESLTDASKTTTPSGGQGGDGGESVASFGLSGDLHHSSEHSKSTTSKASGNQWKYDVLDARVLSAVRAIRMIGLWLPRLVRVGKAAREDEKRRAARVGGRRMSLMMQQSMSHFGGAGGAGGGGPHASMRGSGIGVGGPMDMDGQLNAFEVFLSNITPSTHRLVEHATFCALGSNTRSASSSKDIVMTFGQMVPDKLRSLLRSPLPPSQSTKVGKELAQLVGVLSESSAAVNGLRHELASSHHQHHHHHPGGNAGGTASSSNNQHLFQLSPMDDCKTLGDLALTTIEKRRCIYAFDVCARACSNRAAAGKFDADALNHCLLNLSEQLSRPEECANEVEKGCELVVRRCCEGLASYVRDRGDSARLAAVAECADVLAERIEEIVRQASYLTTKTEDLNEVMTEDVMGLESAMFDEYLDSIRQAVESSVRLSWLDQENSSSSPSAEAGQQDEVAAVPPTFPPYLSASLLAIVRCRAQVEQALGNKVRQSEGVAYQYLSMQTVADGVVEGICGEVMKRKLVLRVRQADRLANELEFLRNTLQKFLSASAITLLEGTLNLVCSKAGRTGGRGSGGSSGGGGGGSGGNGNSNDYYQRGGDGPDGLAALEELERLGRVYVLCLGE